MPFGGYHHSEICERACIHTSACNELLISHGLKPFPDGALHLVSIIDIGMQIPSHHSTHPHMPRCCGSSGWR